MKEAMISVDKDKAKLSVKTKAYRVDVSLTVLMTKARQATEDAIPTSI